VPPLPPFAPGRRSVATVAELSSVLACADLHTIQLESGTYPLSSTVILNRSVTLTAATSGLVVLDGQRSVRILHVTGNVNVTTHGLVLTRGFIQSASSGYIDSSGAGMLIDRGAALRMYHCSIIDNRALNRGVRRCHRQHRRSRPQ
jgi:hypothetical protein